VILSGPGRSGGDEPGVETIRGCVHQRRTLNARLSSGTSVGTFAVSAGPDRMYRNEAGTIIEPDTYCVPVQKKGWKIDPHVSNLRSHEFSFQGVQFHPKGGVGYFSTERGFSVESSLQHISSIFLLRKRNDSSVVL